MTTLDDTGVLAPAEDATGGVGLTAEKMQAAVTIGLDEDFPDAVKKELEKRKSQEMEANTSKLWPSGFFKPNFFGLLEPKDKVTKMVKDVPESDKEKMELLKKLQFGSEQPGYINLSLCTIQDLEILARIAALAPPDLDLLMRKPHILGEVMADELDLGPEALAKKLAEEKAKRFAEGFKELRYGGNYPAHQLVNPGKSPQEAMPKKKRDEPELPPFPSDSAKWN